MGKTCEQIFFACIVPQTLLGITPGLIFTLGTKHEDQTQCNKAEGLTWRVCMRDRASFSCTPKNRYWKGRTLSDHGRSIPTTLTPCFSQNSAQVLLFLCLTGMLGGAVWLVQRIEPRDLEGLGLVASCGCVVCLLVSVVESDFPTFQHEAMQGPHLAACLGVVQVKESQTWKLKLKVSDYSFNPHVALPLPTAHPSSEQLGLRSAAPSTRMAYTTISCLPPPLASYHTLLPSDGKAIVVRGGTWAARQQSNQNTCGVSRTTCFQTKIDLWEFSWLTPTFSKFRGLWFSGVDLSWAAKKFCGRFTKVSLVSTKVPSRFHQGSTKVAPSCTKVSPRFHAAEWSLVEFHLKINRCCWGNSLGLFQNESFPPGRQYFENTVLVSKYMEMSTKSIRTTWKKLYSWKAIRPKSHIAEILVSKYLETSPQTSRTTWNVI